jgi:ubiquinone/menaquinone biosynthesis C-methylase UbiE
MPHVCPWWGGYFIDNRFRRLIHKPEVILAPYVQPGMTVIDFGCGMGFFSIPLARLVGAEGRVVSADLQQKMLDVLRNRAAKAGVAHRIHTHQCEPNSIGIDEPFDFALAFYSVHEVPNAERVITEIYGLLRSQGRFLIVEPVGHVGAKDFESLLSLGGDAGFKAGDRPPIRLSRAALLVK